MATLKRPQDDQPEAQHERNQADLKIGPSGTDEICLKGHLTTRADWFDGLTITREDE